MDPGGVESGDGEGASALDLGAVALAELLHFVAALDGGFGRRGHGKGRNENESGRGVR